jgi:hypothetical protein
MKKIVLSLASVLAATAFAPEASALPAFARQTGQACNACHFQHFPVLNATGQEFKAGGFTQMSAKGKIKGEGISIPDQLNAAVLLKAKYTKTSGTDAAGTVSGTSTNGGQWALPDEFSLFFGGRIGESSLLKMGFLMENALAGPAVKGSTGIIGGVKVPIVITALDSVSFLVVPFVTDSLGMAYGYDQSSGGIVRGIRWSEHHAETYAGRFTGLATGAASGLTYVVKSDIGYINLTRWAPHYTLSGTTGVQLRSNWLRIAATPTFADWAMHIGLGIANGSNYCNVFGTAAVAADKCDTKGNVFDVQAQGVVAEMETSLYFATSKTPKSPVGGTSNYFNASTANDLKATTIGAEVSVIPHTLHLGAAYRKGKQSDVAASKDDAITVQAIYDLFQNAGLHAVYSKYSGPAYDLPNASNSKLTLMLESAW